MKTLYIAFSIYQNIRRKKRLLKILNNNAIHFKMVVFIIQVFPSIKKNFYWDFWHKQNFSYFEYFIRVLNYCLKMPRMSN